jgi:hypothetical protein
MRAMSLSTPELAVQIPAGRSPSRPVTTISSIGTTSVSAGAGSRPEHADSQRLALVEPG